MQKFTRWLGNVTGDLARSLRSGVGDPNLQERLHCPGKGGAQQKEAAWGYSKQPSLALVFVAPAIEQHAMIYQKEICTEYGPVLVRCLNRGKDPPTYFPGMQDLGLGLEKWSTCAKSLTFLPLHQPVWVLGAEVFLGQVRQATSPELQPVQEAVAALATRAALRGLAQPGTHTGLREVPETRL